MPGRGLVAASDSTPLVRESCAVACIHDHQHHPRAPAPAQAALPSSPCGTADEKTERVFALPFKNHLSVNHSARADASVYSVHFAARRENRRNAERRENRDARTENARVARPGRRRAYMRVPREIEVVRRGTQPQGRGGGAVPRVSGRGTFAVARSRFAVCAPCSLLVSVSLIGVIVSRAVERDETWRHLTQRGRGRYSFWIHTLSYLNAVSYH